MPMNLLVLIGVLFYFEQIPHERIRTSIQELSSNVDFSYLGLSSTNFTDTEDTLRMFGYSLQPQNVQFKFLNLDGFTGTVEETVKHNTETYEKESKRRIKEPLDYDIELIRPPPADKIDSYKRANATVIALARNAEAKGIIKTMKQFEKTFNDKFRYPYTFLNDEPFSDEFKKQIQAETKAHVNFVVIPAALWDKPLNIDTQKESEAMQQMADEDVAYAKMGSYHNMCRFYLGSFYNLPILQKYRYYWRIEPDVDFYSDLKYDVFKYMEGTKKKYGFTINLYDIHQSVKTLWVETLRFLNTGDNYKFVNPNGAHQWLLENKQQPHKTEYTQGYSTCHFWSNFEVADMDFFRSEAYDSWFKFLDSTGKFYYERWGDAPVHSMGVALFADKKDVHWFQDIGYHHSPYLNCPNSPNTDGCRTGAFTHGGSLENQNCMGQWIDYAMGKSVY